MSKARGSGVVRRTVSRWFVAAAVAASLTACHGDADEVMPAEPATVSGTAAVGAALAGGSVAVTDSTRASVCAEAAIFTSGTGAFTCTVLAGKLAPFLVVVTDPSGGYAPMVSVVGTTPAAGSTLVANATPLTTAIVAQLAPDGNALSVVADPSLVRPATLAAVKNNVLAQIAPVLSAVGAPAGYDPFTTQLVAATGTQAGNTADHVIELLRFSTVDGVTRIATVDDPNGSVPVAGATTTNPPVVASPSPTAIALSTSLRQLASALTECFALPVAARALATDTTVPASQGGPTVTTIAPECRDFAHANYLNSGYTLGQRLYGLLTDRRMVGAVFSPAEIMWFNDDTTAADNDRAVLNIRFKDANGVAGNLIELARKLPGSATPEHATDWWVYGNQHPVDSSILSYASRSEQFAPNPGTAPFAAAGASRSLSGLILFVNKDGPGSTGMRAARVKGPGLPPAGVVLTRPDPAIVTDQNWLNIRRKDGLTDPASATFAGNGGNGFLLQRTQAVSGPGATQIRPNPNAGNNDNTTFVNWAHPLDYGAAPGASGYIDFAQLKANNVYQFEFFYDGEVAPRHTFDKLSLAPVVPAPAVANLQWHTLTPATLTYLDPASPLATAQASMNLAWNANPFAETIRNAAVFTFTTGLAVADTAIPVARGATTAVANGPGTSFPALANDGSSGRSIQLIYRMLDGSFKDSFFRFN